MTDAQITRYTRNENGQLTGCMVAGIVDEKIRIGMSKCMSNDVFNKEVAKDLAVKRMNITNRKRLNKCLHPSMERDYERFQIRCAKYFKDMIF